MDKREIFKTRVRKKFTEEMGKFFGGMVAFMFGAVYIVAVLFARFFSLGRNSSMNYLLDIFLDSIVVGFLFLSTLAIVNLLRAPYIAGKELENTLAFYETKTLKIEVKTYGGVQSQKEKKEVCALMMVRNLESKKIVDLEISFTSLGIYTVHNGNLSENIIFSDLGNISWSTDSQQYTRQISLVPEEEALVYFAMTDIKTNSVLFAIAAVGKLPQEETVYNIKFKLKGKLDGETDYRFYTHDILLYWNPETETNRRQFGVLDGKFQYQNITAAFLKLLDKTRI